MTNELVRRFNPTTTNRIAPAPQFPVVHPVAMGMEMHPAIVNRFEGLFRGRLHALQAPQHPADFTQVEPRQGRFDPFQGSLR